MGMAVPSTLAALEPAFTASKAMFNAASTAEIAKEVPCKPTSARMTESCSALKSFPSAPLPVAKIFAIGAKLPALPASIASEAAPLNPFATLACSVASRISPKPPSRASPKVPELATYDETGASSSLVAKLTPACIAKSTLPAPLIPVALRSVVLLEKSTCLSLLSLISSVS